MNGDCRDGVRFALMRPVTGRTVDYFSLPDGKKAAPFTLIVALHDYASHCISQFQIIQKEMDRILIKIKPKSNFTAETAENIRRIYQGLMGNNVKIEVEMVQSIEREKSGKYRLVISEYNRS
jgi:phenylacetate-CoA ligase